MRLHGGTRCYHRRPMVTSMLIFLDPILRLLGCTDTMMPYARQYSITFIPGLAVNVFNATMSNLASRTPALVDPISEELSNQAMVLEKLMHKFRI